MFTYHHRGNDESSSLTNFQYHQGQNIMSTSIEEATPPKDELPLSNHTHRIKKLFIAIPIISIILFAIIDSQTNQYIQTGFESFLIWISAHLIAGIFALTAVYAIATVTFIPGSILTIGSGFVYGNAFGLGWGVAIASGVVFIGASCGAILSFLLGRYLLREWVGERFVERYPMVKALDQGENIFLLILYTNIHCAMLMFFHYHNLKAMNHQGLKIFLLLRLSPIVPFNIINYIGGVTAISFKDYTLALFGIIPGTILYCFIGASAGSLLESQDDMKGTVMYVGVGKDLI
jgi:uncharacterized membrane protein YdjX (TVP38/TMEM64 family)